MLHSGRAKYLLTLNGDSMITPQSEEKIIKKVKVETSFDDPNLRKWYLVIYAKRAPRVA